MDVFVGTGATRKVTVTGTSQRAALPSCGSVGGTYIRLTNYGNENIFVTLGDDTAVAADADGTVANENIVLMPGSDTPRAMPLNNTSHIAYITALDASGNGLLQFELGNGGA